MAKFFNKNLKYVRTNLGMSQQDLADKLSVDRTTISKWEHNDVDATVENAIQVASILNVPLADFLGRDLTDDNFDTEFETYFNQYKNILTSDDKDYIRFIIDKRKKEMDIN